MAKEPAAMTSKAIPVAAIAFAGALLTACVGAVEAGPPDYAYGRGPAHPAPAVYHQARVLAPAQVVNRLHGQGYRRVESVTFRPNVFWRGRGIHDDRLREGAYIAEIDRARRPDAYLVVNPHTGQVIREYHGRL
jgi:hypothetical protein